MNVERLAEGGYVVDGQTVVPADPKNADYQCIVAWLAAGNTPAAAAGPDLAEVRRAAEARINDLVERAKVRAGIVVGLPGMVAQYASNAFYVERWIAQGRPEAPEPDDYPTAEAERQGYEPARSLAEMLAAWEAAWTGMNAANAGMMLARRRALEAVKRAGTEVEVEAAVAELGTGLGE